MSDVQRPASDARAGIERYRELAKYLLTIFAAVGALLMAGTQLSGLSKLTAAEHHDRLLIAVVALGAGLGATLLIIRQTLVILGPIQVEYDDLVADESSRSAALGVINRAGSDITDPSAISISLPSAQGAERGMLLALRQMVLDDAAFALQSERFNAAVKRIIWLALATAVAITVFTVAVNPPKKAELKAPLVPPRPTAITFALKPDARHSLASALGAGCVKQPAVNALAIGGNQDRPIVVTVPTGTCKAAQLMLSQDIATWTGPAQAVRPTTK